MFENDSKKKIKNRVSKTNTPYSSKIKKNIF